MKTAAPVDQEIGRLLADCVLGSRSGILTATRGKHKRLFCVEQGQLVHVGSNVIEEQFSELLVQERLVTVGDLAGAQRQSEQQRIPLARLLVDAGTLDRERVVAALESHVQALLFATLDWHTSGEASFARGLPDLGDEIRVELRCVPLLLEYARQHPATLSGVQMRIGFPGVALVAEEERRGLLEGAGADNAVRQLFDACDGVASIDELMGRHAADAETAWRALYGAWLLGLVRPAARAAAMPQVTREEILQRIERAAGADHYAVLEIGPATPGDKIREAYYVLARSYHPDRFRTGPLSDLREGIEGYFSQVTAAYNSLADSTLRAAYDEQMASVRATDSAQDTFFLARENFRRAKELVARGRFRDAVTSIDNAIELDPRNATYRLEAGRLLARNPRMRVEAERHLLEANRLDPSLVAGYQTLGELYLKSGRRDEAAQQFREVLRWDPTHAEASVRLSELGAG